MVRSDRGVYLAICCRAPASASMLPEGHLARLHLMVGRSNGFSSIIWERSPLALYAGANGARLL
jgi:hypothetical protein